MRKQIAAANWKMNLTLEQGIKLTEDILSENIELQSHQEAVFGIPFCEESANANVAPCDRGRSVPKSPGAGFA